MRTTLFDLETTGLAAPSVQDLDKQPKIIELGIVVVVDGHIVEEYSQLVNPGEEVSAEITKITGITNAMLVGMPTFAECIDHVERLFREADVGVAHNMPFDSAVLSYELKRLEKLGTWVWPPEMMCTVQEYVHEFGHRPKLTELYEKKMGRPLTQTHRALDDIKALVEVLLQEGLL